MQMPPLSGALTACYGTASRASKDCPRTPGPDGTEDPDFPKRGDDDGPDSTSDPDAPGRGGDTWGGPDGPIDSGPYCP